LKKLETRRVDAAVLSQPCHIKAGTLRGLAVTTAARSPALPDLPTVGEFVPGYEASGWNGILAPRNTPIDVIERLNAIINAGLTDPKIKARFAELGATSLPGSSADFRKLIIEETEKWHGLIRTAGIALH
jgi:tripartite-type tricarboxylate transporter receptor subunit TctC